VIQRFEHALVLKFDRCARRLTLAGQFNINIDHDAFSPLKA
jgi:hypothetical protein